MILFLLAFVAFLIIGIPISVSIGFSAVLGCLSLGYPLVVIGQKMVSGIDSWLLIAIPLFILAGNLMNAGKITDELFGTARELVGWIPGGLGHANVLASVIFAGMSGSASADAPYMISGIEGGKMGPMTEEAAVTAAEKSSS